MHIMELINKLHYLRCTFISSHQGRTQGFKTDGVQTTAERVALTKFLSVITPNIIFFCLDQVRR